MSPFKLPSLAQIGPETPLRLNTAAALGYPDGSMTASGLRREAAKGRLVIERVAGKDYTTLDSIKRMRELCRVEVKDPGSGSGKSDGGSQAGSSKTPRGSSSTPSTGDTKRARDAALMIVRELRERSQNT
jgi:hypothetical protein